MKTVANIYLNDAELDALVNKYPHSFREGCIDYNEFSRDVEEVFTPNGLESDPSKQVRSIEPIRDDEYTQGEISIEKENLLKETISSLQRLIRCRGLHHKPFFASYDLTRSGLITPGQLSASFQTLAVELTQEQVGLIATYYRRRGRVDYVRMCAELDS